MSNTFFGQLDSADDNLLSAAGEASRAGRGLPKSLRHVADIMEGRDVDSVLEKLFHIRRRGTTWQMEVLTGFVQFISCMYVLPVVPSQLSRAGFDDTKTVVVTVSLFLSVSKMPCIDVTDPPRVHRLRYAVSAV